MRFSSFPFTLLVVIITLFAIQEISCQCSLNIPGDLPDNEPIYLDINNQLWNPQGSQMNWEQNGMTYITCGAYNLNEIFGVRGNTVAIKCNSDKQFLVNGVSYLGNQINCTLTSRANVQRTGISCGNGGTIFNVGFRTTIRGAEFVKYFEVCFNDNTASAIYTHHKILGRSIKEISLGTSHKRFSSEEFTRNVLPDNLYAQTAALERLKTLIGDNNIPEFYSTTYLARGHLTPDADGVFKTRRYATYFYINAAPMWQKINNANWKKVENLARRQAADLDDDLEIFTGTQGISKVRNRSNQEVPFYLGTGNKIEVPEWLWKVLKYGDSAIAFVTYNNPFATSVTSPCDSICAEVGWAVSNFELIFSGRTYCCNVTELRRKMPSIPDEAAAINVLRKVNCNKPMRKRCKNIGS